MKVLIAEDEPLAREGLADWVRRLPQLELVACASDGHAALQAIRTHQPALVLMDIQMPGLTGLQVLRALGETTPRRLPAVIFTTAYDEHALSAFELHAVDYLLKPFSHERFVEAVDHALADSHGHDGSDSDDTLSRSLPALEAAASAGTAPLPRVLVRDMGRIVPLQVEAIEYLRSDTKYTALSSRGRQYLVRLPIVHFETRLDPGRFLKLSRSCIVNLDFVESMSPDENSQFIVKMRDGSLHTANREVSRQLRANSL